MSEHNKAQIRRVIEEAYNRSDPSVVDEMAANDLVIHAPSQQNRGREGVPATSRQVRLPGADIDRIIGGKVVACWAHVEELGLMRQLGVIEADPAASGRVGERR